VVLPGPNGASKTTTNGMAGVGKTTLAMHQPGQQADNDGGNRSGDQDQDHDHSNMSGHGDGVSHGAGDRAANEHSQGRSNDNGPRAGTTRGLVMFGERAARHTETPLRGQRPGQGRLCLGRGVAALPGLRMGTD
jgi:hypothetical protein